MTSTMTSLILVDPLALENAIYFCFCVILQD